MEKTKTKILSDLGIENPEEYLLKSISYIDFAETYFRNPDDSSKPLKLEAGQKQAINAIQFGYDIDATPADYINYNPPMGIVMIWPRQTGKTTAVVTFASCAVCLEPGVKIGILAQSEPTAKEIIRRIKGMLKFSPISAKIDRALTMEIEMDNGSVVRAHASSDQIRGFSYHYLIMDEASRIDDDIIEGAALHTTRKIGKRWIMLSTPKGYRGLLVKYYKQGLKTRRVICKKCLTEFTQVHFENVNFDALKMPAGMGPCPECGYEEPDETGEDGESYGNTFFYGAGDYTVISVDPFKSSFYPKKEIIAELERGDWSPKLRQELLGEIIPEGEGIFTLDQWQRAVDRKIKNAMQVDNRFNYIMGVDFGKVHDNSVIVVIHEDPRTKEAIVDYVKIIYSKYHGKEYEDIKNDIIDIVMAFNPTTIVPDATGMGEPIVETMSKDLIRAGWYGKIYSNKKNRLGFIFDMKSKPDLIDNLSQYFSRSLIKVPPETEPDIDVLKNELLSFSYEMTQSNYIKYGVQIEHDDTVIALALALWALRYRPWVAPQAVFAVRRGEL